MEINDFNEDVIKDLTLALRLSGITWNPRGIARSLIEQGYVLKKSSKQGFWKHYSHTMMECSVCGRHTARHKYKYCPHCGTEMKGELKNE